MSVEILKRMKPLEIFLKKKGFESTPKDIKRFMHSANKNLIPIAFRYTWGEDFIVVAHYKNYPDKYFKIIGGGFNDRVKIENNEAIRKLTLTDSISEEELREQIIVQFLGT